MYLLFSRKILILILFKEKNNLALDLDMGSDLAELKANLAKYKQELEEKRKLANHGMFRLGPCG